MSKKKPLKVPAPANLHEAAQYLAQLGDLYKQITDINEEAGAELRAIAARAAGDVMPLADRAAAIQKSLRKWAEKNRPQEGKTIALTTGAISWRDGAETLLIDDGKTEEEVVALLRGRGFVDCVRTKHALDKEAVKRSWPELCDSPMRGLSLAHREFFYLHPLQLAEPIEIKTKTARIVDQLDGRPRRRSAA